MTVSQAGDGGVGALCVPRAKFRRGKQEKGQKDRQRSASVPCPAAITVLRGGSGSLGGDAVSGRAPHQ